MNFKIVPPKRTSAYVKPYKRLCYSQKLINYVETSASECDKK